MNELQVWRVTDESWKQDPEVMQEDNSIQLDASFVTLQVKL